MSRCCARCAQPFNRDDLVETVWGAIEAHLFGECPPIPGERDHDCDTGRPDG